MLLSLLLGAALLVQTLATPYYDTQPSQPSAQVVRQQYDTANMPNAYNFYYDANDGSSRTERGTILNAGTDNAALDVNGAVRWYDSKGQLYEMTYKAGKRGYRTIIKKVS
ncbi:endocuticle structural glycoprotein ABD-5-like [Plodia interpunctella]|uniref:endocuticle structural glycoprotein ABD-5-like n=1 Tax=Plodia interpunctella TaxID=58824 RepID=UPI0023676F70|nr:endocuticle structural glycoprotein ABD-5-like [Plodia interpunctella]